MVNSTNLEADKMRKANAIFDKLNVFKDLPMHSQQIKPMFSEKLDKKARQAARDKDAGKNWHNMEKVELTEELRNDLKAIKFRNQIFPKRFYKASDHEKLPQYF